MAVAGCMEKADGHGRSVSGPEQNLAIGRKRLANAAKSVPSPPLGKNACPTQVKVGPESVHLGSLSRLPGARLPSAGVALHFPLVWQRMVVLWGQQPALLAFK